MRTERNNLKAGIFILVSVGLIVAVIFSINGIGQLFAPQQQRTVSFRLSDDLGGLRVGDEVRLGGFKVGAVQNIEVRDEVREVASGISPTTASAADATRLLVTFTLPRKYTLRQDAVVAVQTTVTGTASLNISHLGAGEPAGPDVALVGTPSSLSALLATLGEIAPEIRPMVTDARGAVAEVRSRVVPNLDQTMVHFKGAGEHLEDLLGDTKGDIRGTMANLNETTATLREKLPETLEATHRFIVRIDDTVKDTHGMLEDVKQSMANFRQVSETARQVVSGNRGKLDSMIASLKTTGDNLKAASVEIRHSPWRLLYKPGKGEMANLNLYDSARQFADGAASLNDAALALRDALAAQQSDPKQVRELLHKLDQSFAHFRQMEDKLWTSVQE